MKHSGFSLAFLFALSLLLFAAPAASAAPTDWTDTEEQCTVFKNVRVFDGTEFISPATVVIRGSVIVDVGKNISIPDKAVVIEGEGLTLLPGLMDAHVHAFSRSMLRQEALFGVTTVFDMMTTAAFMQQTKAKIRNGDDPGLADLYSSGQPATCPGGHGSEWGTEFPTLTKPSDAARFVGYAAANGADYVKIMSGDGNNVLDQKTIEAVTKEAWKQGLTTLVHIQTRQKAAEAIAAGVNGLAHCFADVLPDEAMITTMKENHVFVIPTLSVMNGLKDARVINIAAEPRFSSLLHPELVNYLATLKNVDPHQNFSYAVAQQTVGMLHKAGIPILAGSDSYNPGTAHGASLHGELELLTYAGLTPTEALKAATSRIAETFKLNDRGRIAPGLRADLLLVKGDPSQDITATRNIEGVWLRGQKVDRESYVQEIARLHKQWKETGSIPPPMNSETGTICTFDANDYSPNFGFYFCELGDGMMGGKSTSRLALSTGGAQGSPASLEVSGTLDASRPDAWAGAAYFPSSDEHSLPNLSKWDAIEFWAQSTSGNCTVMCMRDKARSPSSKSVTLTPQWQRFVIPFSELGTDGKDIQMIIFGAAGTPGKFFFRLDSIRLVRMSAI